MTLNWQNDIINSMIKEKEDTTIGEYIAFIEELQQIEQSAVSSQQPTVRNTKPQTPNPTYKYATT